MSGFLERMAAASRERAAATLAREPLVALRRRAAEVPPPPALRLHDGFDLVAELKLRSPAEGALGAAGQDIAARVSAYASGGAAAVSVLTEPAEFHGRLEHLAMAAAALAPLGVPAMRKDFLVDPCQLHEARAAGAGGALLIARMLSRAQLGEMLDVATELGLFVLVECFDAEDITAVTAVIEARPGGIRPGSSLARSGELDSLAREDPATSPGRVPAPVLVGVNCRDLQTLAVRQDRFAELAPLLPGNIARVAESGIATPDACAEVVRSGYTIALIGSALMRAPDPAAMVATMLAAGRAAAGRAVA